MEIQSGHQRVMPYLILREAQKFFDFVKTVFDGHETHRFLNEDGSLMHGEVNIGGSTIMFGDSGDQWEPQPAGLFVYADDPDSTYRKALEQGATVVMEMADKDYGRTGGVKDPFGNVWWITSPPATT